MLPRRPTLAMRTSKPDARDNDSPGGEYSPAQPSAEVFPEISDYAVIGDCRSCALIDRTGAIEWMCLPDFSSPSLFAALLDRSAGHFRIAADVPCRTERTYAGSSAVLQTRFHTPDGVLQLTDCAVLPPARACGGLHPQQELLREVECLEGCVPVCVEFAPRPDYGSVLPRLHDRGRLGWHFRHGRTSLYLRSEVELRHDQGKAALIGRELLREGECRRVSLMLDDAYPCVFLPLGDAARQRVRRTIEWWQQLCSRCTYEGRYREAVERSLLTLKVMTSCHSGAMLAAATASLPEWIGGDRNWDYRYCWVRDSALALHAFLRLGYLDEAGHLLHWLLHGTRLRSPLLQVMYDHYGETRLHERELRHLSGYRGSRPVRTGNAAHRQMQLDVLGEVIDALFQAHRRGLGASATGWALAR